jgi:thiol-disulfide isomerase/thioredoxin
MTMMMVPHSSCLQSLATTLVLAAALLSLPTTAAFLSPTRVPVTVPAVNVNVNALLLPPSVSSLRLQRRRRLVVTSSTTVDSPVTSAAVEQTTVTPAAPAAPLYTSSSNLPPANAHVIITKITSVAEWEAYLSDADADESRVTVVKFHASWCKSCQKFGLLFHKLAVKHADWVRKVPTTSTVETNDQLPQQQQQELLLKRGTVRMASVEWSANTELCRSLGIQKLPTVHFYKGTHKLAGFAAGPAKMPMVVATLEHYQSLSQSELQFESDMVEGERLVEAVMPVKSPSTPQPPALSLDSSTFSSNNNNNNNAAGVTTGRGTPSSSTELAATTTSSQTELEDGSWSSSQSENMWGLIHKWNSRK